MPLRYTAQTAIALRLAKRLQVGGAPQTYGKDVMDTALLDLVGPQCESRLDALLAPYYRVPLGLVDTDARAIVASVVEKMILCEALPVHVFPDTGKEGGVRKTYCDEWRQELDAILSGRVKLEGEQIAPGATQGFPYGNRTEVVKRGSITPGRAEQIEW